MAEASQSLQSIELGWTRTRKNIRLIIRTTRSWLPVIHQLQLIWSSGLLCLNSLQILTIASWHTMYKPGPYDRAALQCSSESLGQWRTNPHSQPILVRSHFVLTWLFSPRNTTKLCDPIFPIYLTIIWSQSFPPWLAGLLVQFSNIYCGLAAKLIMGIA